MIKKYVAAALLGTALAGGAAFAQTTTPASPSPAPAASASSEQMNLKGNWRASKLVGLAVYNDANEKLGDVSEIILDKSGKINAVIIGVGGFLGVGQHDIAVTFDKLKWVEEPIRSASADKMPASGTSSTTRPSTTTGAATTTTTAAATDDWYPDHAVMSGTKEQLKAMPAFKYSESTK
ncbi:PRC-barrel domain containing protein [Afipia massiliensis]|uniref:PRC-barrel domain containing protein n=1 Tax=Afipia massiliensis TaxID=211460 RepID=A0A4U6BRQ4_9BRAD|nr:PRC-barrel domain-containing protein [Afipia massiliensis]TKT72651.1 PRC-barrel domain containing protein [Afipia massiliensis]